MEDDNEKGSENGGGNGVALVSLSSSTLIVQSHTNGVNRFLGRAARPLAPLYTPLNNQRKVLLSGGSDITCGQGKGCHELGLTGTLSPSSISGRLNIHSAR